MTEKDINAKRFLDLIQKSRKGKFKVYIGMSAGVGKTFRMLQEVHTLLRNGIDVKIGFIETHNRKETHELLEGLLIVPKRSIYYKGKYLEEMDVQAIINLRPEAVKSIFTTSSAALRTLSGILSLTSIPVISLMSSLRLSIC